MRINPKPLLAVVLSIAAAGMLLRYYAPDVRKNPAGAPESVVSTHPETPAFSPVIIPETDPLPEGARVVDSDGKASYRIKSGQPGANRTSAPEPPALPVVINWQNEAEAQAALDSALSGNIDDAVAVGELIQQCARGYDNEKQIEQRLKNDSTRFTQAGPVTINLSTGIGDSEQFENFDQYEDFLWDQFASCHSTRGMFDPELRERLVTLAQDGSVSARFLYAMWLPDQGAANAEQLIDWLTYQSLALEFTLQNLKAGEPLGLLAYGRSLQAIQPAYFTPMHSAYGKAFMLAAQKCGLNNGMINARIANMTDLWNQRQMARYQMQTELLSDQIVDLFCKVNT